MILKCVTGRSIPLLSLTPFSSLLSFTGAMLELERVRFGASGVTGDAVDLVARGGVCGTSSATLSFSCPGIRKQENAYQCANFRQWFPPKRRMTKLPMADRNKTKEEIK
jgi:hypothetical protein